MTFLFQTSNFRSKVSDQPVEKIVAEQKEETLEEMNKQFRNAGFGNDSSDMDQSESFEFSSPILSDQECIKEGAIVSEPSISTTEHKVVSCTNISELEELFGCLNIDTSDGARIDGIFENLIEEEDLDQNDSENTKVKTREDGESEEHSKISEQLNGKHYSVPVQDHGPETPGTLGYSEKFQEQQETFLENDPTAIEVLSDLDTAEVSEVPVTSSVNVQENFTGPTPAPEEDLLPDSLKEELNDDKNENIVLVDNDQTNKDLSFADDLPATSTPEYHLETSPSGDQSEDYGIRRSYSEDLLTDDTLTDGSLIKSSSELSVSPSKDEEFTKMDDRKLSSRSLGSLQFTPTKGRVFCISISVLHGFQLGLSVMKTIMLRQEESGVRADSSVASPTVYSRYALLKK